MASASITPVIPAVGDKFLGVSLVWTVVAVTPIVWVDDDQAADADAVKVVLTHPLAGELHLPLADFQHMVTVRSLTVEP